MESELWDAFLTNRDRAVAAVSGYGGSAGFGDRPALLVIDVTTNFCGDKPEPILDSIEKWRNSCGEEAWKGIAVISQLLRVARVCGIPVIYSGGSKSSGAVVYSGRWADKNRRRAEDGDPEHSKGYDFAEPIAPDAGDIVIRKTKPSVFFGTPLLSYLVALGVDTLICCGATTSGCVRATVIDAFSYNFRVNVVADATFDRTQSSHAINLYDMHQKYADIVTAETAIDLMQARTSASPRLLPASD